MSNASLDDAARPIYMTDRVWGAFSRPQTITVKKVIDDQGNVYELNGTGLKLVTDEKKPVLDYYYPAYRIKEGA